jgi:hypothetical protein
MHGGRISSVISELPCNEQEAVNKLAFVTWQAISIMFSKPDPASTEELNFGYVENVVRRKIVGSAHIVTQMSGDLNHPRIKDFPKVNFSVNCIKTPQQATRS